MKRHKMILVVVTLTSVAALVTAVFFAIQHFLTPPIQWQTYREPHGMLTIAIPSTWSASETQGQVVEGITGGASFTETIDVITAQAKNHTGMSVGINLILAPESPGWRTYVCAQRNAQPPNNTTIAGIPARYEPVTHDALGYYVFLTSDATFEIQYRPGQDRSTDAALYAHMIQSLMPFPDQPFTC
jgi:hypothetical protein